MDTAVVVIFAAVLGAILGHLVYLCRIASEIRALLRRLVELESLLP